MSVVGRVAQLWRYPVKSMGGERLAHSTLGPRGIVGDRGWALRDEQAGEIRGAKKLAALLHCSARYLEEPGNDTIPCAEISLPDGSQLRSDDSDAAVRLSQLLGRQVTLWPLQPATATAHYRRGAPDNPDMLAELRSDFGRTSGEPLPDLSVFPRELVEFTSLPGTYFDAFPLHLLTTASLATLKAHNPSAQFDVRRFRPNVVVETDGADSFVENEWTGRTLHIGNAHIRIEAPCPRCVMTTLSQEGLSKDASVLRTIVRDAEQNVGVYATIVESGRIAVGDAVELRS